MSWPRRIGAAVAIAMSLLLAGWAGWMLATWRSSPESITEEALAETDSRAGEGKRVEPLRDGNRGWSPRQRRDPADAASVQVLDDDGAPVAGGVVTLWCSARAGERPRHLGSRSVANDGRFASIACDGLLCVDYEHPTHIAAEPWTVDQDLSSPRLSARPLARVSGIIVDAANHPVAGARVSFLPPQDGDAAALIPFASATTTTDADGMFSVAVLERPPCHPCGEAIGGCRDATLHVHDVLEVLVQATGHAPLRRTLDVEAALAAAEPLEWQMSPKLAPLRGTLHDASGAIYSRAYVLARSRSHPAEQHRAEVEQASFAFEGLGHGLYDLRALQDGVLLAAAPGVEAGDTIALRGGPAATGVDVVIRVVQGGEPVEGAEVSGGPFLGARTDEKGEVRAERAVVAGASQALRLRLKPPGRSSFVVPVALDGGPEVLHVVELEGRTGTGVAQTQ